MKPPRPAARRNGALALARGRRVRGRARRARARDESRQSAQAREPTSRRKLAGARPTRSTQPPKVTQGLERDSQSTSWYRAPRHRPTPGSPNKPTRAHVPGDLSGREGARVVAEDHPQYFRLCWIVSARGAQSSWRGPIRTPSGSGRRGSRSRSSSLRAPRHAAPARTHDSQG